MLAITAAVCAFKTMSAEEIALGLDEVGDTTTLAVAVEIPER